MSDDKRCQVHGLPDPSAWARHEGCPACYWRDKFDAVQGANPPPDAVEWAREFLWRVLGQQPPTNHVGELARELQRRAATVPCTSGEQE